MVACRPLLARFLCIYFCDVSLCLCTQMSLYICTLLFLSVYCMNVCMCACFFCIHIYMFLLFSLFAALSLFCKKHKNKSASCFAKGKASNRANTKMSEQQQKKPEVTLEMYQAMTEEEKATLPKKRRKKLEKGVKAAAKKAAGAAKELARLEAAAKLRSEKKKIAASVDSEAQSELDKIRNERLGFPVFNDLKHQYSTRTMIKSLLRAPGDGKSLEGKVVEIGGWVRSVRTNGTTIFVIVNDGSCLSDLQVVCSDPNTEGYVQARKQLAGSAMQICGLITTNKGTG